MATTVRSWNFLYKDYNSDITSGERVLLEEDKHTYAVILDEELRVIEIAPHTHIERLIVDNLEKKARYLQNLEILLGEDSVVKDVVVRAFPIIYGLNVHGRGLAEALALDAPTIMNLKFEGNTLRTSYISDIRLKDYPDKDKEFAMFLSLNTYAMYVMEDWNLSYSALKYFVLDHLESFSYVSIRNPYKFLIEWFLARGAPKSWYGQIISIFNESKISPEHMVEALQIMHDKGIDRTSNLEEFSLD